MRWLFCWMVVVLIILSGAIVTAADPCVIVDGRVLALDVPPVIEDGRTLVPLRPIFNALGAAVDWNETTKTATASKAGVSIKLTIGQPIAYRNGAPVTLAVPAKVVNDRTMVPLRFVSEALGAQVGWDNGTQTASITSVAPNPPMPTPLYGGSDLARILPGLWSLPGSPELPEDTAVAVDNNAIEDGEWYLFSNDGTFLYVWMGSNPFISGAAEGQGRYRLEGNNIIFTDRLESWFSSPGCEQDAPSFRDQPGEDETLPIALNADGTLSLGDYNYVRGPEGVMRPEYNGPWEDANSQAGVNSLVGLWSSRGTSGELIDPSTGAFQRSAYSGEWYLFRDDGTFRYVIIGAGQIISGAVVREGKYRVEEQKIVCYESNDDWYPDPSHPYKQEPAYKDKPVANETMGYELSEDNKTLKVGNSSTFYRVQN